MSGRTASAMNHRFELGRAGIVLVSSIAPPAFCGMTTSWTHIDRSRLPAPATDLEEAQARTEAGGIEKPGCGMLSRSASIGASKILSIIGIAVLAL